MEQPDKALLSTILTRWSQESQKSSADQVAGKSREGIQLEADTTAVSQ